MARQLSQAADGAPEHETVLHSWCIQTEWNAPTVIGGEGARLFTADGRTILDMSSLAECSNLGHQHPRVVAAIRAQAQRLCFLTSAWGAEPRARLASLLFAPPLVISERELAETLALLDQPLGELTSSLAGERLA